MNNVIPAGTGRWHLVQTRPHQEAKAETNLRNQHFETFLPSQLRTIRHGRRFRTALRPLFPRYLFVRFSATADRWRSITGTFGVARLVASNDVPTPVPVGVVENLMASLDVSRDERFEIGDAIRLTRGPFAGLTGRLAQLAPDGRVRVLLAIMGGEVPLEVRAATLEPAA
jgi:transcriptional antiterminator RfaH